MEEQVKFSFTVSLPHKEYVLLLNESKERESARRAVPSRTARQLVIERLSQLEKKKQLLEKKASQKHYADDADITEPEK